MLNDLLLSVSQEMFAVCDKFVDRIVTDEWA
jgi:hypothetical protein